MKKTQNEKISFWWEEEFDELLLNYHKNDFLGGDEIKLFIIKIIQKELNDIK